MFACGDNQVNSGKQSIVVTYSVLGAIVKDLVGDQANVKIAIPNGLNLHEWEPSARVIETINKADLVIQNGLGLEDGLQKTLDQAQARGVKFFTISDYIDVRHVGIGEGIPSDDPDQAVGAADPHLWLDPITIASFIHDLANYLKIHLGLDVEEQAQDLQNRLESLDQQIRDNVATLSVSQRKLVTGHESLGYFAQRYEFKLVGAVIPSLSDQASVSAANMASLKQSILDNQVTTIFTELGTSAAVVSQIGAETSAKVVQLSTHTLSDDGSYFTFMQGLSDTIINSLKSDGTVTPPKNNAPMDIFITPFSSNDFMKQALIAGILVSIACAVAGTFVILRGMAFIGDALSHGVLPGIALSILLGVPGILGAAAGAICMIGGVTLITQRSRLSSDTAIGLLFIGMLSLGVVIVSRSNSFSSDLTHILFGEILGTSNSSIIMQMIATAIICITAFICARPFLLLSFDPEQAQVAGFSAKLYHNIMLFMIASTIIVSFQTVGTLLVFGLLIAPAGAGALLARRIRSMIAWAIVFGLVSVYSGLLLSYHFDLAAGASIILVTTTLFFITFIVQNIRSHSRIPAAEHHD
ncbi:MAG: metal ABC transporter permease [Dehalococcoidia bacterium]|nr:metal ABC transporter permease [Dehalococcoidia bacterium]